MAVPESNGISRVPLHQQIAALLRSEIRSQCTPGDKLPSESKLAKRFGVSVPTVRESLSTLAQEGLVERRHGSGTYVAKPQTKKHVAIFIEMDLSHPRTSYFYLRVTRELRRFFDERQESVRLYMGHAVSGEDEPETTTCPEFIEDVQTGRVSGVVAVGTDARGDWLHTLSAHGAPAVGGTNRYPYSVTLDYEGLVREGVRLLAARGCQRLALMGGAGPEAVFHAEVTAQSLRTSRAWMHSGIHPAAVGAGPKAFLDLWNARPDKPDGLLITDDVLYQSVAMTIVSHGISVPDELCVATHANRGGMGAVLFPTLLLEFDPCAYAETMGDMLLRRLRGQPVATPHVKLSFEHSEAESALIVMPSERSSAPHTA